MTKRQERVKKVAKILDKQVEDVFNNIQPRLSWDVANEIIDLIEQDRWISVCPHCGEKIGDKPKTS